MKTINKILNNKPFNLLVLLCAVGSLIVVMLNGHSSFSKSTVDLMLILYFIIVGQNALERLVK